LPEEMTLSSSFVADFKHFYSTFATIHRLEMSGRVVYMII